MNTSIENAVCVTEFAKKKVFEQLMLADASSARHCHDSLRMRRNMDES